MPLLFVQFCSYTFEKKMKLKISGASMRFCLSGALFSLFSWKDAFRVIQKTESRMNGIFVRWTASTEHFSCMLGECHFWCAACVCFLFITFTWCWTLWKQHTFVFPSQVPHFLLCAFVPNVTVCVSVFSLYCLWPSPEHHQCQSASGH